MATRVQRTASISYASKDLYASLAGKSKSRHFSLIDNNIRSNSVSGEADKKVFIKPRANSVSVKGWTKLPMVEKRQRQILKSSSDELHISKVVQQVKRSNPTIQVHNIHHEDIIEDDLRLNKSERKKIAEKSDSKSKLPEDVINIDVEDGLYEYAAEVIVYLKQREQTYTLSPNFLEGGSTSPVMRSLLMDWLIQVQHHLNLCQETLYLTIAMIDTVLSKREIDKMKLQLVGITCLLMASKLEEYYPADIRKLIHLTSNSYTLKELLKMELVILEILEFQLYFPEIMSFLRRYLRAALRGQDEQFSETCQYLIDASIIDSGFSTIAPSKQAASSILATNVLLYIEVNKNEVNPEQMWSITLEHYTTYSLEDVIYTAKAMIKNLLWKDPNYTGALRKFQSNSKHKRIANSGHLKDANLKRAYDWFNKTIQS